MTTNRSFPTGQEGMFSVSPKGKWKLMVWSLVWLSVTQVVTPLRLGLPSPFTGSRCNSVWEKRPFKDPHCPKGCRHSAEKVLSVELILNKVRLYDHKIFPSTLKVFTKNNGFHWYMQIDISETMKILMAFSVTACNGRDILYSLALSSMLGWCLFYKNKEWQEMVTWGMRPYGEVKCIREISFQLKLRHEIKTSFMIHFLSLPPQHSCHK